MWRRQKWLYDWTSGPSEPVSLVTQLWVKQTDGLTSEVLVYRQIYTGRHCHISEPIYNSQIRSHNSNYYNGYQTAWNNSKLVLWKYNWNFRSQYLMGHRIDCNTTSAYAKHESCSGSVYEVCRCIPLMLCFSSEKGQCKLYNEVVLQFLKKCIHHLWKTCRH